MTFPIIPSNSPSGIYAIDNSLRFNGTADSCYLSRTPSSTTDRQKFTISFWVKRCKVITRENVLFQSRPSGPVYFNMTFRNSGEATVDRFHIEDNSGMKLAFAPQLRDVSAWYHIVFAVDTTQATASNRVKFYLNGTQVTDLYVNTTYPSQNANLNWNVNQIMSIGGSHDPTNQSPDIYLAEAHSIDGQQLSPTDFGEFDTDSGIWKPIEYTGSYGTNGFYLDFENSGSLGADQSGNSNNFTPTNLASTDQTTDTPTNNFATLNANLPDSGYNTSELSEGNLIYNVSEGNNGNGQPTGNMPVTSGKWYWEIKFTSPQNSRAIGLCRADKVSQGTVQLGGSGLSQTNATISLNLQDQQIIQKDESGTTTTEGSSLGGISNGDIFGHFLDLDNGTFQFYKNGSAYGSQFALDNLSSWNTYGALPTATGFFYMRWDFNFGNPPFSISSGNSDANGYGNFEYSPNDGTYNYLALCTQNLATALSPTIDDGSQYFNSVLWSGDSTNDRDITGVGFQPDWVWIKERYSPSFISNHALFDSTRGGQKGLSTNTTDAEYTSATQLQSFITDGFNVNDSGGVNGSGETYVAWNWKCTGSTSSNTDGSITSTVQANTTAGFSIVTYTGNGTASTIGHGLGVKPKVVILKNRSSATDWLYLTDVIDGSNDLLNLNQTGAKSDSGLAFTSTTFATGSGGGSGGSGSNYVAYCFAEIEGYSKFGSYTGNGSSDGTFVYTGFRPAWVMCKCTSTTSSWIIYDVKRKTFNVMNNSLIANLSNAEATQTNAIMDILSNGFKLRGTASGWNSSGDTFIYMAFAENPFVSSTGIPVTAR